MQTSLLILENIEKDNILITGEGYEVKLLEPNTTNNRTIDEKKMFNLLIKNGYINEKTKLPHKTNIENGLLVIRLKEIRPFECEPQTFVTPKGLEYLMKKYKVDRD
jgi:phage antirepressor YoqD-like protein